MPACRPPRTTWCATAWTSSLSRPPCRPKRRSARRPRFRLSSPGSKIRWGSAWSRAYAQPGGNITGVTTLTIELAAKRLELFRDLVPGLHRVLYPYDATHAPSVALAHVYREAARHLGIDLVEKPVQTEAEVQALLAQVREHKIDGIVQPSSVSFNIPGFIMEATAAQAMPTMFDNGYFVEHGGLASYGPDDYASGWQAARLVDKILKGTAPREIPVEVSTKLKFVINLKTAKALGLTIPPPVLFLADEVIR